jgi:hypothetical protein
VSGLQEPSCAAERFPATIIEGNIGDMLMRSIALWLLGIPIPIIILIALFVR